jgi:hypothetical protein
VAFNLNDAEPQKTFEPIPDGQFARLLLQMKPGGYSYAGCEKMDEGLFRKPKEADAAVTMECELTVVSGPYKHRKFTEYWTVYGGKLDEKGHSTGWNMTKTRIRAMIESNQNIRPDDMGAQAVATRQINGFAELQNIEFFAKVGIDPGNEYIDQMTGATKMGFDKNKIDYIVTPDKPEYADLAAGKEVEPKPSGRAHKPTAAAPGAPAAKGWGADRQSSLPGTAPAQPQAQPSGPAPQKPSWLKG